MRRVVNQEFKFTAAERSDLIKSFFAIGIAFTIASNGLALFSIQFYIILVISILTAGIGFLLHELGHKFVAQKYGYLAHYVADKKMLMISIFISFLGFIFAAPGAVVIQGRISKKEYGIISAAGPIANLIIGLSFLVIGYTTSFELLKILSNIGFQINIWIGLFNMIPVLPFDGAKIYAWNKQVFFALGVIFLFLMFL